MDAIKALEGNWVMLVGDEQLDPDENVVVSLREGHVFREGEDTGTIVVQDGLVLATLCDEVYLQLLLPDGPGTVSRLDGYMVTEFEKSAGGDRHQVVALLRDRSTGD